MNGQAIKEALSPVLFLVAVVGLTAIALSICDGCKPVENPGAHHQAIVESLAYGVSVADQACASIAKAKGGREGFALAKDCAFAYDAARVSLIAAEDKLAKDTPEDVACETAQALAYANQMAGAIEKHGGKLPKALAYAFATAPMLAERCP
jgi:hypothetical protein